MLNTALKTLLGHRFLLRNDYHAFSEAVPIKAARRFLSWFIYCPALTEVPATAAAEPFGVFIAGNNQR